MDPKKVVVNDENIRDGVLHISANERNVLDVDATAAGPGEHAFDEKPTMFASGKLRAEIRDADGELLIDGTQVESLGYGKYRVILHPPRAGRYRVYLYWADIVVPSAYPLHAQAEYSPRG